MLVDEKKISDLLRDCCLDHIAVAVKSLSDAKEFYQALGLVFVHEEVVEDQRVRTAFAHIDQGAKLELLESITADGPIAKFIEKRGSGLHHLCFQVSNIRIKQQELEAKGIKFIYPEVKKGANNCLINFIHPKSSGGVLIELSQKS